jgi:hypothetical protein
MFVYVAQDFAGVSRKLSPVMEIIFEARSILIALVFAILSLLGLARDEESVSALPRYGHCALSTRTAYATINLSE